MFAGLVQRTARLSDELEYSRNDNGCSGSDSKEYPPLFDLVLLPKITLID